MSSKKKGGVIGFDPLAWMKNDDQQSPVDSRPSTANTDDRRPAIDDTPGAVALGEMLTIEQAAAMHAELGRHLGAASVALEAGALQRVDAAGLQLLVAFTRAATGRGTKVEWRSPSTALREGARRLGLSGALGLS